MHAFFLGFNELEIWYSVVFEIADYVSELKIQKLKVADPTWCTKMQKVT